MRILPIILKLDHSQLKLNKENNSTIISNLSATTTITIKDHMINKIYIITTHSMNYFNNNHNNNYSKRNHYKHNTTQMLKN